VSDTSPPLSLYIEQIHARAPRSRRIGLIAGYFRITAVASAVGLAGRLLVGLTNWGPFWSTVVAHPLTYIFWPINIAAWWWTGQLIGERQRTGALMAISSLVMGTLGSVVASRGIAATTIVIVALGIGAIASVWKELE
jgi:hypothetical protein